MIREEIRNQLNDRKRQIFFCFVNQDWKTVFSYFIYINNSSITFLVRLHSEYFIRIISEEQVWSLTHRLPWKVGTLIAVNNATNLGGPHHFRLVSRRFFFFLNTESIVCVCGGVHVCVHLFQQQLEAILFSSHVLFANSLGPLLIL